MSDELATLAYQAMKRVPRSREQFEAGMRARIVPSGDALGYGLRRLALRDVYGDQAASIQAREDCLAWLRTDTPAARTVERIAWVKRYYARDAGTLADFIADWGYTNDPRLLNEGKNPLMAFELWPRQRELVAFFMACWYESTPGVVVKARDVGASWCAMALLASLCIFRQGFAAGVGSAVEVKIDRSGDPDTLFYKARSFLEHLPLEFNGGYDQDKTSAYMRLTFPLTGSSITGEAGDQAGRGGRKSIFIVDESAHFEHPKIIDKNLSANTKCRIDISSVNGMANSFYTRAHNNAIKRFDFTWLDDPRKNYPGSTWAEKTQAETDEVTWRQEFLCDFRASLEGACIPADWALACVDIDKFLGIDMETGTWRAALDVADRGIDLNALAGIKGRKVRILEKWSGKGSDVGYSVQRAMRVCADHGIPAFDYDADGMGGASVHTAQRYINEARNEKQASLIGKPHVKPAEYFAEGGIGAHPYRGSEAVVHPERPCEGTKRKNIDMFQNRKAQSWYAARMSCWHAWKARKGQPYDVGKILCIDGSHPLANLLVGQLSQATVKETMTGKIQIDKNPDDVSSPDVADAVVIANAPRKSSMTNMAALLTAVSG